MRSWFLCGRSALVLLAAALSLLAMAAPVARAADAFDIYGQLPNLENFALSPDGKRMAFVRTDHNLRMLVVADLPAKILGGGALGEVKLRDLEWADSDHLLITTSTTTQPWGFVGGASEWFQLAVFDVTKRKLTQYPQAVSDKETMNVIVGSPMIRHVDGDTLLFIHGYYVQEKTRLALFKVNLNNHTQHIVREGGDATWGWLVDDRGEIVVENNYYEREQRWQMRIRHDGHWFEAGSTRSPVDVPHILGFGPDGASVLVSSLENKDRVWKLISLTDGKLGAPIAGAADLNSPFEDPASHHMIGGLSIEDQTDYVFFNADMKSRWKSITNAYENERVELVSTSADLMHFIVLVDGPEKGYRYEMVDMNTHRASALGDVYTGLKHSYETRRINYEAADGLKLPAYLTLPAGRPATKLPLIVFPHGGPASRDTAEFDWWAQAMASAGYAVLKTNFRGSTTTTSMVDAGYGEWGKKMQTDLSDGVRYLAKQGIIDPARVCIVGASYGGYAALAGVTLDPGIYRCAVSVAGISDLKVMLRTERTDEQGGDHLGSRYWNRYMGVEGPSDPKLDAISPIKHLDAINVPVMLIHGKDDTVVPFEQSEIMLKALKKANKPVEMVTLKKEDHWLSRGETRLQMLQSSMAFLKAHNPPD